MRIVAIFGTPRKENTFKFVKLFEENLVSIGVTNLEFDYVFISELELDFCQSCFSCYYQGEGTCLKAEKTLPLLEKISNAEGLILATPVYSDSYSALMKTFIDHFAFLNHRPRFFNTKALIISTTHETGTKYTMQYLEQTARRWGCEVVGSLGIKIMQYTYREKYQKNIHQQINILAKRFIKAINENKRSSPTLSDLIFFRIMRVWTSIIAKDVNKTDYNYWKEHGWLTMKYFIPVKINPIKSLIASFVSWRVKKAIER